ncbi:MAG TPA: glycosyltransferase [Gemmataceae bacterium]|jgi:glycosyltransferase involved in cell wall biosynthesis
MTNPDAIVSVVAYLCNDADLLHDFVGRATAVLEASCDHFELILLDDHSTDRTPRLVGVLLERYAGVRYIRLARRGGEEVAAAAGLDAAIGDYVVFMRARFDPPEAIADMLEVAEREGGTVLGVTRTPAEQGWLFRACRRLFYRTAGLLLRAPVPADSTGFCVLARAVVNTIARTRSKSRHLRLLACTLGYPVTRYRYDLARPAPVLRRRPLLNAFQDALRILVSSSQTPLRLVSALGILAGSLNLCYVLYVLAVYFFKKEVAPGWVTLSLQLAAMFFFVFLILVSLSEYVVQILAESQDNPLYHVESDRTSAVTAGAGRRNVLSDSTGPERKDEAA